MLWRHGIGLNFWPKCWSRGALNNQSLSVCGIPGVAGSWGRGDHSKNILQPRTQACSRYPSDQRRLGTEREGVLGEFSRQA